MDFKQIKELVQILEKSGLTRLTIKEKNGEEITLEKERAPVISHEREHVSHTKVVIPQSHPPIESHSKHSETDEIDEKKCVKSPMVGTFYRAESPDKKPFKEVGDSVNAGDIICIIEAMKVMNEIKSPIKGKVTKILAENGSPVEYGQKLFVVE